MIIAGFLRFSGFGDDGGPAAKELALKLNLAKANLSSRLWVTLSNIEVRQASVTIVSLIAIGGVIFVIRKIFVSTFSIVSPILYDIYNNGPEDRYFSPFWIELFKDENNAALQLQIFRSYKA
ncbi:hypothetical protein DY000_02013289 [Brassica cretica]|uniref:Uncharacterized protein n=1 Tax=Brassica cretica TaxID=69181 RepID=A0ABQ7CXJ2_BRACR|nr:hypothetical protein DY000_02013289 [Brassica cretica]